MFDTFIAKAICPYCKKEKEYDFQSKEFECELHTYRINQRILYCPIETGVMKRALYEICNGCNKTFYVDMEIKNCKFAGVRKSITKEQYQKEMKAEEKRWKKTKKYKEQQKHWRKISRLWGKLTRKRGKKGFPKPRACYLINLKNPPDLSILKKKEIQRYRFKKLMKGKIFFEILKKDKGRSIK